MPLVLVLVLVLVLGLVLELVLVPRGRAAAVLVGRAIPTDPVRRSRRGGWSGGPG